MKLFLASLANVTLDLVIPLLPADPHQLMLAFIPTAADPYPEHPWLDADRQKAVDMGFSVTDYDIKGKSRTQHLSALASFDVIFVTGGNTFYLLKEMQKSDFDLALKELIQKGKIYIGSSAGSCILCPTLKHITTLDHPEQAPELVDYTALNLIPQLIVPHAGREKYAERHALLKKEWGDQLTFLRDDQVLIFNDNIQEIQTLR